MTTETISNGALREQFVRDLAAPSTKKHLLSKADLRVECALGLAQAKEAAEHGVSGLRENKAEYYKGVLECGPYSHESAIVHMQGRI